MLRMKQLVSRQWSRRLALAAALALSLVAVVTPVTGAASSAMLAGGSTLTTTTPTVSRGDPLVFHYSTPAANVSSTNWVGIYTPGATPGQVGSLTWQYTPNASGTVTFNSFAVKVGTYEVYYFYNDGYTMLAGPINVDVQAAPTPSPSTTPPPPGPNTGSGPNLIVNGNAELGEGTLNGVDTNTVPGWKVTGLLNSVAYGATGGEGICGYPTPAMSAALHGGNNFFSGGGGGISTGTQAADVSPAAERIDRGGVTYNLTAWLGGTGSLDDNAQVTSTFLGAEGEALGSASVGPVTPQMRNNTTTLLPQQALGKVPGGTRSIRTVLTVTGPQPHNRQGHGQGYADNISLKLSTPVPPPHAPTPPRAQVPGYDHVFVVMMENQDYSGIIGNVTAAPYINSLVPRSANLTNAIAETHPSDPNYVAMAGGSLFGVTDNTPFSSTVDAPHIGDRVAGAGGTWRGYMQNANGPCDTTAHGSYTIDDLPFYFFKDVKGNPANCKEHLRPLPEMSADLAKTSTTPTFSWLSADGCYDMEGCGITAGDTWLSQTLPTIFNSPAWTTQRSLLILTWDEDAADGQQMLERVPTMILGSQGVQAGSESSVRYTHYSMLRTIEAALHLPSLTKNDLYADPIDDIWTSKQEQVPGS